MKAPEPNPWIYAIPEYVAGRSKEAISLEYGISNPIKLASNENPLGPSPKAMQALRKTLKSSHLYPDPDSKALRACAAGFFGCNPGDIIAGNGSDEIIDLICRAYLREEAEVIIPSCTFSYYRIASLACGARTVTTPMKGFTIDIPGIIRALTPRTKVIFIANPNNPTGTYLSNEEIQGLMDAVPGNVLVVLDEAYGAFARAHDFSTSVPLAKDRSNIITVHTLSKSHGLAGLRVGFGISSRGILDMLMRIKPPFNVNILAQKAGEAALNDRAFFKKSLKNTWDSLDMLYREFDRLGFAYIPSQTNFVLVHMGKDAPRVYEDLMKKGIITRYMANMGLDEYIRMSIGTPSENRSFLDALEEVL